MSATSSPIEFKGKFHKELAALRDLLDKLWNEHGMSFVKAGDDKVYAFGGNHSVVVFDESKWEGLIELITPSGGLTIKPDENGQFTISGNNLDDQAIMKILNEGISEINAFYDQRYWKTPEASS
jgi:hypothetical protein